MSESKAMPFYNYNRAKGMEPAEAAHNARTNVLVMYALWLKLVMSTVLIGSIMFVCMHPMFEHTSGFERMRVISWALLAGMVISAIIPLKAKSIILWVLYAIILGIIIRLIVISS